MDEGALVYIRSVVAVAGDAHTCTYILLSLHSDTANIDFDKAPLYDDEDEIKYETAARDAATTGFHTVEDLEHVSQYAHSIAFDRRVV